MRKSILLASLIAMIGTTYADIQAPPGSQYTSSRKFGRAVSNILYGFSEVPEQMVRRGQQHGSKATSSYGVTNGVGRAFKRMGYGFYELFTFHCPTYHGTYKPPYAKCGQDWRIEMNPTDGLSEFPPELGAETYFGHTRQQKF
jgi:putative exosortase-associated protein (TIGR04073 family)